MSKRMIEQAARRIALNYFTDHNATMETAYGIKGNHAPVWTIYSRDAEAALSVRETQHILGVWPNAPHN